MGYALRPLTRGSFSFSFYFLVESKLGRLSFFEDK